MSNPFEVIKVRKKVSPVPTPAADARGSNANGHDQDRESCREFLQTLVRGLVDDPDSVHVTYTVGDRTTVYKVDCQQSSLGQIIGAKGKNITGIRTVIAATMARKGIRAIVEIPYFAVASA